MESIVNYIKDGKEINKRIDTLDCLRKDENLFEKNKLLSNLKIKDDIEFVDFQNFSFSGISDISTNEKTLCILDNCSIPEVRYPVLHFNLGHFQIINPKFSIKEIELKWTKDFSIYFDNADDFKIESLCGCINLEIYSNYSVKELISNADQVKLNGLFEFYTLELFECEKVTIGNNEQFTKMVLKLPFLSTIMIQTEELNLNNCLIVNDSEEYLAINCEKLIGNNFMIKSRGEVLINGHSIPKELNEEGYMEITIDDIIKYNFTDILCKIQLDMEHIVEKNANKLIPQKFGNHILLELNKLKEEKNKLIEREIRIQQKIIELENELKREKEVKTKKLIKELKNNSINKLDR